MPTILCPNRVRCPGTDFPVRNWSSEVEDRLTYIGVSWGYGDPDEPINQWWLREFCGVAVCTSTISQEDADLCAARAAAEFCPPDPQDGDPDIPPPPLFRNQPQACSGNCPDGTTFTYIVPAGRFVARSQIQANLMAYSFACRKAGDAKVCMSEINGNCCDLDIFSQPIRASGHHGPFTFSLVSGMLPTGFTMTQTDDHTLVIAGIPTAGTYPFTIRATDANGSFMQKNYVICSIGISPNTLPNGTVGTAYSQTLTATACATPTLSWQVTSGALPDGLTLDEFSGVISGTPTLSGTFNFTITLQTEST